MKLSIGILTVLLFVSCSSVPKKVDSFFVAGHVYGSPLQKADGAKGLYKPFKEKYEYLRSQDKMSSGFLLGDVVWKPSEWNTTQEELKEIGIPVEVVRGNHDGPLKPFENRFGKSYKKFKRNNNLYIILDSNLDQWNISGDQLVFLMNTLRNDAKDAHNVFIFVHHVLWYTNNKFSKPFPNSVQNRASETNFWSKVEPLLKNQSMPIYIFAGDVGAASKERRKKDHIIEYYYHFFHNNTI